MLYGLIRVVLAGIILSPFIFSQTFRKKLKAKRGVYIVSICCSILVLSLLLYQVPFENHFGGFKTIDRAIEYKYGTCETFYTIEHDGTVLVLTNKTSEILHKERDRFYLISSVCSAKKDMFASGVHVTIYDDTRTPDRFVQVAILPYRKIPEQLSDNKSTRFEKGYTNQGITNYFGCFQDDGSEYVLFIDGVHVDLVDIN